jgi:hypothetical protein
MQAKSNGGISPLHQAAGKGCVRALEVLEALGADMEAVEDGGHTPLHRSVCFQLPFFPYHREVTELLVELGANKEARDDAGRTPLLLAVEYENTEAIKALVGLGAEMGAKNNRGETPLECAVVFHKHQAAQLLTQLQAAGASAASRCAACGAGALKRCASCKRVKYCSTACQRTHWKLHKGRCQAPERRAGRAKLREWAQQAASSPSL